MLDFGIDRNAPPILSLGAFRQRDCQHAMLEARFCLVLIDAARQRQPAFELAIVTFAVAAGLI